MSGWRYTFFNGMQFGSSSRFSLQKPLISDHAIYSDISGVSDDIINYINPLPISAISSYFNRLNINRDTLKYIK